MLGVSSLESRLNEIEPEVAELANSSITIFSSKVGKPWEVRNSLRSSSEVKSFFIVFLPFYALKNGR
jgi:hypothetical protein